MREGREEGRERKLERLHINNAVDVISITLCTGSCVWQSEWQVDVGCHSVCVCHYRMTASFLMS